MKQKIFNVVAVLLIAFTLAAWGLTTVTGQRMINSTIDSTPIGNTIASTGRFISLVANSISSGYVQAGSTPATSPQGAFLGWNITGGGGETDFVNSRGTGIGGWRFYNVATGGAIPSSPVTSIDGSGNVTGASFNGPLHGIVTGNVTGNLTGNASTASALAGAPSNCGNYVPATGVQPNGNANCGNYPNNASAAGYATLVGGFILQWKTGVTQSTSGFSQVVTFPLAFPHAAISVNVGTLNTSPTDTNMSFYQLVNFNTSSATVYMQRNADHAFNPAAPIVWAIGY